MNNFKAAFGKPRVVALYASMTVADYYTVMEVTYSDYDEHYQPLPKGQKRENTLSSYVRISEPIEVSFDSTNNDEMVQRAVASLDAEERETINEMNRKIASIRERKSQLLAISFQPEVSA